MCCMSAISSAGKKLQTGPKTCTSICPEILEDSPQECLEQSLSPLGEMFRILFFQSSDHAVYSRQVPTNCIEVQTVKYFLMLLWTILYLGFTFSFFREWRRVRLKNRAMLNSRRKAAELISKESDSSQTPCIWFDSDEPDDFAMKLNQNRMSFLSQMEEKFSRPRTFLVVLKKKMSRMGSKD